MMRTIPKDEEKGKKESVVPVCSSSDVCELDG
jgi:hypothetical protein